MKLPIQCEVPAYGSLLEVGIRYPVNIEITGKVEYAGHAVADPRVGLLRVISLR